MKLRISALFVNPDEKIDRKNSVAKSSGITHAISDHGHRQNYQNIFSRLFSLSNVTTSLSAEQILKLVNTKVLLISTIDDRILLYSNIIIIRSIFGKRTVSIFLRPQSCFTVDKFRSHIKYILFSFLKKIPRSTIITITPFLYAEEYKKISNKSVMDPQYWDYIESNHTPLLRQSILADELQAAARGRPVLLVLGAISKGKGIEFLADIVREFPEIINDVLIVVAGSIDKELEGCWNGLHANGVELVSRWITDAELESLYSISSLIWACYHPSYDQASGVFGRSAQFNKTCLVRSGALLEQIGADMSLNNVALEYGDTAGAFQKIKQAAYQSLNRPPSLHVNPALVAARDQFVLTVDQALTGSTP
jgi:glycosyltransferase involved in cell wall biosynthesis